MGTQASLAALWSALATLYATFLAKFLTSRRILVSAGSGSRLILWTVSPAFRPQSAMLLVKFLTQLAMPVFVLLVSIATSILSLEHCLVSRTSFAMLSAKYSILQTTPVSALPALTATRSHHWPSLLRIQHCLQRPWHSSRCQYQRLRLRCGIRHYRRSSQRSLDLCLEHSMLSRWLTT